MWAPDFRACLRYLAANVRRYRKHRGLTQEALAARARVSTATVQRIERGATVPKLPELFQVAMALEVGLDVLFGKATMHARRPGRPAKPPTAPEDSR